MLWMKIKKDSNTTEVEKVRKPSRLFSLQALISVINKYRTKRAHSISVHVGYIVQTTDTVITNTHMHI